MGYNHEDLLSDMIAVKISEEWMFEQLEIYFRDYCRREVVRIGKPSFFDHMVVIMVPYYPDKCVLSCISINEACGTKFKIIEFEETECYEIYCSKIEKDYVDDFENILFDF